MFTVHALEEASLIASDFSDVALGNAVPLRPSLTPNIINPVLFGDPVDLAHFASKQEHFLRCLFPVFSGVRLFHPALLHTSSPPPRFPD